MFGRFLDSFLFTVIYIYFAWASRSVNIVDASRSGVEYQAGGLGTRLAYFMCTDCLPIAPITVLFNTTRRWKV